MSNQSNYIKVLKEHHHTLVFKNFLGLFAEIIKSNHDKMDVVSIEEVSGYRGQNLLLKKLIKDLTVDRKIEYPGL